MVKTVVGYIENSNQEYLMLYRNKRINDPNHGKWIGVGGHIEENETKEIAIIREINEETGLVVNDTIFKGAVEFHFNDYIELMYVFKINNFSGRINECDEGLLKWINKNDLYELSIWEGDKLFLNRLDGNEQFFLKLYYDNDRLLRSEEYDISEIY